MNQIVAEFANKRLFDLVRFMRAELHEAGLITDTEYEAITCERDYEGSVGRLGTYDQLRAELAKVEADCAMFIQSGVELTKRLEESQSQLQTLRNANRRGGMYGPEEMSLALGQLKQGQDELTEVKRQLGKVEELLYGGEHYFPKVKEALAELRKIRGGA